MAGEWWSAVTPHNAGSGHHWGWTENGDLFWLHSCSARPGWSVGTIDLTSGTKHHLVSREPLTVEASVLCDACGDHGWFRDGKWVSA